jgi:hypothetical protein
MIRCQLRLLRIHHPLFDLSPKPTINVNKKQNVAKKKASQRLTILNINCQSVKSKVPDLHQVIHQVKPDIIVRTESWLTSDITCKLRNICFTYILRKTAAGPRNKS